MYLLSNDNKTSHAAKINPAARISISTCLCMRAQAGKKPS